MIPTATCYMCDSPETSREHAPPLCFFPEAKGIGKDLRQNLITVPSCDEHNSRKSRDDEYFRSVIVMTAAQMSDVGRHQFLGKFLRAVRRTPHVFRSFFLDRGTIAERTQHALQVDRPRFDACVGNLARAILFHDFQRKWSFPIVVESPNFYRGVESDAVVPDEHTLDAVDVARQFLASTPVQGQNPEVFQYRLLLDESNEIYAFAARFYEVFEVFAFSAKSMPEVAA